MTDREREFAEQFYKISANLLKECKTDPVKIIVEPQMIGSYIYPKITIEKL